MNNGDLSLIHPDLLPLPEPPSKNEIKNMPFDSAFDLQSPNNSDFCESGCGYISSPSGSERNTNEYSLLPPIIKKYDIGDGNMSYIKNKWTRKMCENAWQAINLTENWDFVVKPIESFTWSFDKRIDIISDKMVELGYNGHSGTSFGCTMRNMQFLAQNGVEKFKQLFDENEVFNPTINNLPQNPSQHFHREQPQGQTQNPSQHYHREQSQAQTQINNVHSLKNGALEIGTKNTVGNMTIVYCGGF